MRCAHTWHGGGGAVQEGSTHLAQVVELDVELGDELLDLLAGAGAA